MINKSTLIYMLCSLLVAQVDAQQRSLDYAEIERQTFEEIGSFRTAITVTGEAYDIDPYLIVAILYVEKAQYVIDDWLRLRDYVESWTTELRIINSSVIDWADLSTGYCRIKPSFASSTQEYLRDMPLYPSLSAQDVDSMVYQSDPETSIRIMAAGLRVLAYSWERAGYPIADRPGILATLYNLGYEKSEPHETPQNGGSVYPAIVNGQLIPNTSFGERVETVMKESRLLRKFFARTY